jgi:RNA polymerase sigma factor (sigma-70 family)
LDNQTKYWKDFLNGDNDALAKLYVDLFEPLVLKAVYYTKKPDVARDIVSSLFVSLLELDNEERLSLWNKIESHQALLLAIVRNKCLDFLKITQNRERINNELFVKTSSDDVEKIDMIAHLTACIQELKPDEKQLVELHLQGFSNDEISLKLNLNEKTVRNKLSLTRKSIWKLWHQMILLIAYVWR